MIETATLCGCKHPVSVGADYWSGYYAVCWNCYDGTEDAGEKAHVCGHGKTPEAALQEWQESAELAWDLDPQEAFPIRLGPGRKSP